MLLQPDPHAGRWRLALLLFAALLAAIFALAYAGLIPTAIAAVPHYDTWGHAALYGLLCYLAHRALQRRAWLLGRLRLPLALPLILSLAAAEELLQQLSPRRTASLADLAADLAGMALVLALDAALLRLRRRRSAPIIEPPSGDSGGADV